MNPLKINPATQFASLPPVVEMRPSAKETDGENFGSLLKSFVQDVDKLQHDAADVEKKFLSGEISDVHQVMIAAEEASVAFELLMEIRNKLIESYKEIIRTPA
jgi:flagellar hook-basal body complex protein FliE